MGGGVGAGLAVGPTVGPAVAIADALGASVAPVLAPGVGVVPAVHALATSAARQQMTKPMRDTNESLLGVAAGSDDAERLDVPKRPKGQKISGHQASAGE